MQREIGMADTVGDFILRRLTDWGVQRIFGYPGDGISGLMGALGRASSRFDYVRVRHEEMSGFMAVCQDQVSGEVSCWLTNSELYGIPLLDGMDVTLGDLGSEDGLIVHA